MTTNSYSFTFMILNKKLNTIIQFYIKISVRFINCTFFGYVQVYPKFSDLAPETFVLSVLLYPTPPSRGGPALLSWIFFMYFTL